MELNLILQGLLIISPALIFYFLVSKNISKAIFFNVMMGISFFISIFIIATYLSETGILSFMVVFFIIFSTSSFLALNYLKEEPDLKRSMLLGVLLTGAVGLSIVVGLGGFGL